MVEYAIETDLEIKGGPIWTQVEVTTYTGDRETTPDIKSEDIIEMEDKVWGILKEMRDPKEGPEKRPKLPINFTGDITQRDIYCFHDRDIVASCFIKHEEDFIGVKILWNFAEKLMKEFNQNMRDPFHIRNYQVVAESWVEQHHPEIV